MAPKGQEVKPDSNCYCVSAQIIDTVSCNASDVLVVFNDNNVCFVLWLQKFYDRLLSMLEERGIDEKFCDSFVQFCTAFEQEKYHNFLHDVRQFVLSK